MSSRTTLSGCSLGKVRASIGVADPRLIEAIKERVDEDMEDYLDDGDDEEDGSPTEKRRMQVALKAVVAKLEGKPAEDLEDEGHVGYLAATAIVDHVDGEDRPVTPFEVKYNFWLELLEVHGEALGEDADLFRYFETGRPLFGRTISNECIYAWFERDEALRLRDAAQRLAGTPGVGDDVVKILTNPKNGFVACIDAVLATGLDVWSETT